MTRRSSNSAIALAVVLATGCSRGDDARSHADVKLVLAAYSAPREALEKSILPAFTARYRKDTGKTVKVEASYLASGAQSRAVVGGFEADVVLLALAPDVEKIAKAKLIMRDWKKDAVVATTYVAFAVRTGNPKHVTGFADLARPGVEVLMPNPKTSGGAMWNVNAIYAAALAGEAGVPARDNAAAEGYLRAVLGNVLVMDKAARESMITYEKGVGDVAVTYESEIVAGRLAGREYDEVLPRGTMLIETPAAVVDVYADKHGTTEVAASFVSFLRSRDAQLGFTKYGFRSVDPSIEKETARPLPEAAVKVDVLGGWSRATNEIYGPGGVFPRAWDAVNAR